MPYSRESYCYYAATTFGTALVGFVVGSIAGLLVAVGLRQSSLVEAIALPYLYAFQSQPKISVVPIVILLLGIGFRSQIAIAALSVVFPVAVSCLAGFALVDKDLVDLIRSIQGSTYEVYRNVLIPSASPLIFAGLEVGLIYSIIGSVMTEFMGGSKGLGSLLLQMQYLGDTAGVFSVVLVLGLISSGLSLVLQFCKHRLVFWHLEPSVRQ